MLQKIQHRLKTTSLRQLSLEFGCLYYVFNMIQANVILDDGSIDKEQLELFVESDEIRKTALFRMLELYDVYDPVTNCMTMHAGNGSYWSISPVLESYEMRELNELLLPILKNCQRHAENTTVARDSQRLDATPTFFQNVQYILENSKYGKKFLERSEYSVLDAGAGCGAWSWNFFQQFKKSGTRTLLDAVEVLDNLEASKILEHKENMLEDVQTQLHRGRLQFAEEWPDLKYDCQLFANVFHSIPKTSMPFIYKLAYSHLAIDGLLIMYDSIPSEDSETGLCRALASLSTSYINRNVDVYHTLDDHINVAKEAGFNVIDRQLVNDHSGFIVCSKDFSIDAYQADGRVTNSSFKLF